MNNTSNKIRRECKNCEKTFYVYPSRIKNGGGKFCSVKCRGEYQRGENSPFWKDIEIEKRCKNCHRKEIH